MTDVLPSTIASAERTNARTQAAIARLHRAMRDIEAEILTNHGIYPFNYGRVTQSELCRRADVKKATLQNPVHKKTTRVEILGWLDTLNSSLTKNRDSTRERVTEVADTLSVELATMTRTLEEVQAQLAAAKQLIDQLQHENAVLKLRLNAR